MTSKLDPSSRKLRFTQKSTQESKSLSILHIQNALFRYQLRDLFPTLFTVQLSKDNQNQTALFNRFRWFIFQFFIVGKVWKDQHGMYLNISATTISGSFRKKIMMMMMMMMMNCSCEIVDRRKTVSFIYSRNHFQRFLPSQTSTTPGAGFEPVQTVRQE